MYTKKEVGMLIVYSFAIIHKFMLAFNAIVMSLEFIGADLLSIFVLNIPRIFFNIAIFFLRKFQSCAAL